MCLGSGAFLTAGSVLQNAKLNSTKGTVASISLAISRYKFEIGSMPDSLEDLTTAIGQYGPWLSNDCLNDVWDTPIGYSVIDNGRRFAVWSYGANGSNDSGQSPQEFLVDDIGIIGY